MNDRDWLIWAAGFFDGEGCVSIGRVAYPAKTKKHIHHQLSIIVCQKQSDVLDKLKYLFGGFITNQVTHGRRYGKWVCNSTVARDCLVKMLPYLVVKREIAELGIRFQEMVDKQRVEMAYFENSKSKPVTKEEIEARDIFWLQAKALNSGRQSPLIEDWKAKQTVN